MSKWWFMAVAKSKDWGVCYSQWEEDYMEALSVAVTYGVKEEDCLIIPLQANEKPPVFAAWTPSDALLEAAKERAIARMEGLAAAMKGATNEG